MTHDENSSRSLNFSLTQQALSELDNATDWLSSYEESLAARFADRLQEEITYLRYLLAERIAEGSRLPPTDDGASIHFARPIIQHRFQTRKKRQRRSASGLWCIFYALEDADGDSKIDTLVIYSIRHGAALPYPHLN